MVWGVCWILIGIGIAGAGLASLDRYAPKLGTIWNMVHGELAHVPYPYLLLVAACLMLYGGFCLLKEYDKQNLPSS